jgi:hypothetical protein
VLLTQTPSSRLIYVGTRYLSSRTLPFRVGTASKRPQGFTPRHFSLFSRSAEQNTSNQGKLAALESDANASPDDSERQIELFQALLDGGAEQAVLPRWDAGLEAVSIG